MTEKTQQPLVLMYHGVVTEWTALPNERETGADLYDVLLKNFQANMQCLKKKAYKVCSIEENIKNQDSSCLTLTFDDGEMNNYEQAYPVLKKVGFQAYFFIIAKRIGNNGYMGWDELKELHDGGMIIGSHGFSHEILTNLLDSQIEEELKASKRYLERNLGIEIDILSIPRGFCNDKVIQMAYDAGYKHIFISERPRDLESPCYSRIAIKSSWTIKRFEQMLDGNIPVNEQLTGVTKSAIKKIFGGGVYDWLRRTVLKIK